MIVMLNKTQRFRPMVYDHDNLVPLQKGSAEWRKPLESGRVVPTAVTVIKKTKEKESVRGVKIDVF